MRKKIGVMLCICLLAGAASGCGAEDSNLTGDSSTAAVEESSEPEMINAAEPEVEQSGWKHWKQAYFAKAEEIETKYGSLEYDLIYLDSDDIPELVAGPTGYWFTLYTWKDGEAYELIDYAPYGTHGRVYRFEPYLGIIEENVYDMVIEERESDNYTIFYTTYHKVTEDMEIMEQYELIEECRETGSTYFYRDAPWMESREIDVEEFSACIKENLSEIRGRFDLETLHYLLGNTDDNSTLSSDYGDMAGEAVRSLLVTDTSYDGEGAVISRGQIKYEYDLAGNQIRELCYNADELQIYSENKYDDFGNCIETMIYDAGVIRYVKKEYDEDGHIVKSQVCFGDERFKMVSVYHYNYLGNLTMETTYSCYGRVIDKYNDLYEYDKVCNLIRKTLFTGDILYGTDEYGYDDSGNLIKEVSCDAEGNTLWFKEYAYDENGNRVEETTDIYTIKYEYDEQGNKTKEIFYHNDGSVDYYVEWTYEWL